MDVARTYKTMAFSVPPGMAMRIEEAVKERQLTKSELFREMFRLWEEKEKLSVREQLAEFRQLSKEGYKEAQARGINVEDEKEINRIVYEDRQARKAEKRKNRMESRS